MRLIPATSVIAAAFIAVLAAEPRIRPVPVNMFDDEQRALAAAHSGAFGAAGDFRTLLAHPELVKGVLPFANYVLAESTLTPRHRELLILRTAWRADSYYVWAKHRSRALAAGLSAQEVSATAGLGAARWSDVDATLLQAADELHGRSFISNDTWNALAGRFGVHQLIDTAFTFAEMTMIAEVANSVRLDLESGWPKVVGCAPPRPSYREPASVLATPRIEPVLLAQAPPDIR
jgi:alkylhydroperoxidase family enzyme